MVRMPKGVWYVSTTDPATERVVMATYMLGVWPGAGPKRFGLVTLTGPVVDDVPVALVGVSEHAELGLIRIYYGPGEGEFRHGDVHVGGLAWCGTPEPQVGDAYGAGRG